MASKAAFATVGTTQFDKFIQKLSTSQVLDVLRSKGYTRLTIQIGKGSYEPPQGKVNGVHIDFYRFKPSLADDMTNADLVISHAGAGSCLEALEAGKPLLVVINKDLMDNHQAELASQFSAQGFLFCCDCDSLADTLARSDFSSLTAYERGDPKLFSQHLDQLMNLV